VAKLAGLPGAVINRAEHLLADFETNSGNLHTHRAANGHVRQPALFGGPSVVEEALASVDVDSLTPIEAIQKLYELKALAAPSAGTRQK
jgi:DNA mismatch repair protein MutS